jgi:hypothetical protein
VGVLVTNSSLFADGETSVAELDMKARKWTTRTSGDVGVVVMQNGSALAVTQLQASDFEITWQEVTLPIGPVTVSGSYQITIHYLGSGAISIAEIQTASK